MLSDAIATLLKNDPGVAAMVGARIYPSNPMPENVLYPAISFFEVSELREHTLSGPVALARPRIQVDVWSNLKTEMLKLSNRVRKALDGFHGYVSGIGLDGTPFVANLAGVLLDNRQSLYEPQTKTQHGVLDFFVWNDESQETT